MKEIQDGKHSRKTAVIMLMDDEMNEVGTPRMQVTCPHRGHQFTAHLDFQGAAYNKGWPEVRSLSPT